MKIIVLSENTKIEESFESEHGLSVYLEAEQIRCLLDTGASDKFIRNAKKLGVDIKSIDFLFISHGHADHLGGLVPFLELNKKASVIISRRALDQKFFSQRKGFHSISLDMDLSSFEDRFIFVDSELKVSPEIWVFSACSDKYPQPLANINLYKDSGEGIEQDVFNHELIFTFGRENLFVYVGCAHKGLLNILDSVSLITGKNIKTVMGGFHLLDDDATRQYETLDEIDSIAMSIKSDYPQTNFITGHCTGEKTYDRLKNLLGNQLNRFYTGYTTQIT